VPRTVSTAVKPTCAPRSVGAASNFSIVRCSAAICTGFQGAPPGAGFASVATDDMSAASALVEASAMTMNVMVSLSNHRRACRGERRLLITIVS